MERNGVDLPGLKEILIQHKFLIIIILLSVFVSTFYFQLTSFWPDESLYIWFAEHTVQEFDRIAYFDTYLPIFLMSTISWIVGPQLAGKLIISLFSLLGPIFLYLIAKEMGWKEIYGFFAAILMILNPYYLFLSTKILLDVPLTAAIVMAIYFFIRFEKNRNQKNAIIAGIFSIMPLFIKIAGMLVPIIFAVYLLLEHNKKVLDLFKDKNFLIFGGIHILFVVLFFSINLTIFGSLLPGTQGFYSEGHIFTGEWNYYLLNLPNYFMVIPVVLLFFGLGMLFVNFKKSENKLILISGIFYFIFFSFFVGEKVPRYILPAFPFFFLAIVYGISLIKYKKFKAEYLFLLLILLFCYDYLSAANALIDQNSRSYTGFPEAGSWLFNYATSDDVIYAGSWRSIRTFSGFDRDNNGGNIHIIPKNFTEFLETVTTSDKSIILVIDVWEYTQPDWTYPLNEEKFGNLISLGFELAYIVDEKVYAGDLEESPVVFILVKHPS